VLQSVESLNFQRVRKTGEATYMMHSKEFCCGKQYSGIPWKKG
jgi:hypothetical protein